MTWQRTQNPHLTGGLALPGSHQEASVRPAVLPPTSRPSRGLKVGAISLWKYNELISGTGREWVGREE